MMLNIAASHERPEKQNSGARQNSKKVATTQPVLLLLHQKSSCAGAVGNWLQYNGYTLDIRRHTLGEELPEHLDDHAGVIVFGGPMSANDNDPYIIQETDWLALPLREKKPYFGICLGAQMMARHLGATVSLHKDDLVEVGYHEVEPTPDGQTLMEGWPSHCFQWHKEGYTLPAGATPLVTGQRFENQAFSYNGHAFGVQFHPEITKVIIERWSAQAAHMLNRKGAHSAQRMLDDHKTFGPRQQYWLDRFMTRWTSLMEQHEKRA